MKKEIDIDVQIQVNYQIGSPCWRTGEDGVSFVTRITGEIFLIDDEVLPPKEEFIGTLSAIILHITSAVEHDADLEELLDGVSMETSSYTSEIFDLSQLDINPPFNRSSSSDFEYELMDRDLLIIEHICLNKKGRGHGIGSKVLKDIEIIFGRAKLIVMRPFPLQFSKSDDFKGMDVEELSKSNEKKETEKLTKIYENIGYKRAKKSGLVFKSC